MHLTQCDLHFSCSVHHQNHSDLKFLQISEKSTGELNAHLVRTVQLPGFETYVNSLSRTMNFVFSS